MRFLTLFILTIFCTCVRAQSNAPFQLRSAQDSTLAYAGDLALGQPLSRLDWAWDSQNACFVEPRAGFFTGNAVFYRTEIPKYSTMVIRLIPTDPKSNMSLLAYSGGHGALAPDLAGCVSCEADFQQERQNISRPKNDHTRSVELRAVNRAYPVTIAAFGANGLDSGAYRLEVTLKRNR